MLSGFGMKGQCKKTTGMEDIPTVRSSPRINLAVDMYLAR